MSLPPHQQLSLGAKVLLKRQDDHHNAMLILLASSPHDNEKDAYHVVLARSKKNYKLDKDIEMKDKIPRGAAELTTSPGC